MRKLLLFLVQSLLSAGRAVFEDLHLRGMGLLVAGGEIVFAAAFRAFEDRLITFSSHVCSLPSFKRGNLSTGAKIIPHTKKHGFQRVLTSSDKH